MSLWVRKATIAIEDRRFFDHGGVDLEGIARAAVADIKAGPIVEGGSTITQQLVREPLHLAGADRPAQGEGGVPRHEARRRVDEATDPYRVPEPGLLRQSCVRHRSGRRRRTSRSLLASSTCRSPPCSRDSRRRRRSTTRSPFRHVRSRVGNEVLEAMLDTGVITPRDLSQKALAATVVAASRACSVRRDPRAVLLRLRPRQADRGLRCRDRSVGRPQGLHDHRPALPAAGRDRRSADTLDEPTDPAAALISISPRTGAIRAMAAVVPESSEEPVQPSLAGAPAARVDVQDVRAHGCGRAGDQPGLDVLRLRAVHLQGAPGWATATTAAGGACTPTRTTTTAGARFEARRSARTTRSTRS